MEKLWAPWRSIYVGQPQGEGCFLCDNPRQQQDAAHYILYRGKHAFIILNIYPYSNGHLMVAPYRHVGDLESMLAAEEEEIALLVHRGVDVLRRALHAEGFNIGINLGRVAGAGIPGHLHVHIVPRWQGDTNFMPVIGDAKVISEALDQTYQRLREALEAGEDDRG